MSTHDVVSRTMRESGMPEHLVSGLCICYCDECIDEDRDSPNKCICTICSCKGKVVDSR